MRQVINYAYMPVGINASEPGNGTTEDDLMGEGNPQIQCDSEERRHQHTDQELLD